MHQVRSAIESATTDFIGRLEQRQVQVERVYLYGSYLNGTADEWSDVDLLVVSKDFFRLGFWEQVDIISDTAKATFDATGLMIEPLTKTPDELANCHPASFLADVLKNAAIVYDRDALALTATAV